jgi:hypothetical protein
MRRRDLKRKQPSRTFSVKIDRNGQRYSGTYVVEREMVHVSYGDVTKSTQVGGSPPSAIARILLSEILMESGVGKPS